MPKTCINSPQTQHFQFLTFLMILASTFASCVDTHTTTHLLLVVPIHIQASLLTSISVQPTTARKFVCFYSPLFSTLRCSSSLEIHVSRRFSLLHANFVTSLSAVQKDATTSPSHHLSCVLASSNSLPDSHLGRPHSNHG